MPKAYTFKPGSKCDLSDFEPDGKKTDHDKESAREKTRENATEMATLFRRLYAENQRSILAGFARHGYRG